MSQRQPVTIAEAGLFATVAFALAGHITVGGGRLGRPLSVGIAPTHSLALAALLAAALIGCLLWRRGEALTRSGGAVFLTSVMAWLIWHAERFRLPAGAVGVADWPPPVVTMVGWAAVIAWAVARVRGPEDKSPGRGFWVAGAWLATAAVVLLAIATFVVMRRANLAPATGHLAELVNWALLYAALFTVAMDQFAGRRARRAALVFTIILVIALAPIGGQS